MSNDASVSKKPKWIEEQVVKHGKPSTIEGWPNFKFPGPLVKVGEHETEITDELDARAVAHRMLLDGQESRVTELLLNDESVGVYIFWQRLPGSEGFVPVGDLRLDIRKIKVK